MDEYLIELAAVRSEIDEVDCKMAQLFEKRLHLSLRAGRLKSSKGVPLRDIARETEIIEACRDEIADKSVRKRYPMFAERLLELSRSYQQEMLEEQLWSSD